VIGLFTVQVRELTCRAASPQDASSPNSRRVYAQPPAAQDQTLPLHCILARCTAHLFSILGTRLDALAKHDQICWSAVSLHRRSRCCVKTRCWLVHLLRRYFISFIFSPPNIWKIVRFLPQFMLPPFQKRKKPSNDPRPPQHLNLLLPGNPCLLMDKEMDGSQRLRRTMVRFSCSSFERFLPPSTSRRRRCLPRMPHCTISGRYGSEEGMTP
jgi:hypothetical protein